MARKPLKVGVRENPDADPPSNWGVFYLAIARDEAQHLLDEAQYHHIADQFKQLASERDPTHSQLVDVRPIEDFFELRDKGGPLGRLNIRVFFLMDKANRAMIVLGTIKKEADGPTPLGDKIVMRIRKRRYLSGAFGRPDATSRRRSRRDAP